MQCRGVFYLPGLFGRSICLMLIWYLSPERDSFMILGSYFYQSIVHGQQISTIVAVILEKGTSYYYLLNIVV